jgi:hypothetical protein
MPIFQGRGAGEEKEARLEMQQEIDSIANNKGAKIDIIFYKSMKGK